MRSIALVILIIFLSAAFMQPMLETANVYKEKIALGAAILNSCRAASNRALIDEDMRNMDAVIDRLSFAEYFAEAFGDTFDIVLESPPIITGDTVSMSFNTSERWARIGILLKFQDMAYIDSSGSGYDLGYNEAVLDISLTTPYIFRTKLLRQAMNAIAATDYTITENRRFIVRVIN